MRVEDTVPSENASGTYHSGASNFTNSTQEAATVTLIERIPKIWELKQAELPLQETAEQKEAKQEAYGLRVRIFTGNFHKVLTNLPYWTFMTFL